MNNQRTKSGHQRYFIAIIPPSPVFEEALALKNYFKEKYHSKASLNSPPHITLQAPFAWKEDEESKLLETLAAFASDKQKFDIELDGFGAFPPRVIFINPKISESLNLFQNQLQVFCEAQLNLKDTHKSQPFHPHLTLAFRDLKKEKFDEAWDEFRGKSLSAKFIANQFTLLKHNGKLWESLHHFDLNS